MGDHKASTLPCRGSSGSTEIRRRSYTVCERGRQISETLEHKSLRQTASSVGAVDKYLDFEAFKLHQSVIPCPVCCLHLGEREYAPLEWAQRAGIVRSAAPSTWPATLGAVEVELVNLATGVPRDRLITTSGHVLRALLHLG